MSKGLLGNLALDPSQRMMPTYTKPKKHAKKHSRSKMKNGDSALGLRVPCYL